MSAFNNFRYDNLDNMVLQAKDKLYSIMQYIENLNCRGIFDLNVFIELCNDIPHEIEEVIKGSDSWTIGQKRAFLNHAKEQFKSTPSLLKDLDINVAGLDKTRLDTNIQQLRTNLDHYIQDKRITAAKEYAAFMGQRVAQELQKINETWITSPELATRRENLFNILNDCTVLYSEEDFAPAIIEEFLRKFEGVNGAALENLLQDEQRNNDAFKLKPDALQSAVIDAAQNKINKILEELAASLLNEDVNRLHIKTQEIAAFLTEFVPKGESLERQSIEDACTKAQEVINNEIQESISLIKQNQAQYLAKTTALLKGYRTQINEYSGTEQDNKELTTNKQVIAELIGKLSHDNIAELVKLAGINKPLVDKSSAWKYLGDLELNSKLRVVEAEEASDRLLEHVISADELSGMMKNNLGSLNSDMFNSMMHRLVNDIPHAIQATMVGIKSNATIGSSRFF